MYNKQLDTFINVKECGSLTKAAEKMFITPASVMNQMNALEQRIGVKLIERNNQGIALTEAGASFYKDAKKMVSDADAAIARAKKIAGNEQHIIRVGTSLLNPCKTLIDLWTEVSGDHPGFKLQIVPFEDDHTGILSTLSSLGKKFDFVVGACGSKEWMSICNILQLGTYNVCCAVPRSHALAKKESLSVDDLHGENLIMVKRGDSPGLDIIRDMFETEHPQVHIIDTSFFYDVDVFNLCENTKSVLLTLDAWSEIHPSLVTIPVKWNYTAGYGLLYSKKPSKDVLAFLDVLNTSKRL